jgi:hypothetical protein
MTGAGGESRRRTRASLGSTFVGALALVTVSLAVILGADTANAPTANPSLAPMPGRHIQLRFPLLQHHTWREATLRRVLSAGSPLFVDTAECRRQTL